MTDSTKPNGQLTIAVDRRRRQDGHARVGQPAAQRPRVYYCENSPAGQQRTRDAGRDGHRHSNRGRAMPMW